MTVLFIDASAAVAILALEEDAPTLLQRVDPDAQLLWSAIAKWETTVALARKRGGSIPEMARDVEALAARLNLETMPIGDAESWLALDAFARFGKGTGHPAQLNMGDCFAYACAKANNAALLYKGDDFAHTDLA